MNNPGYFDSRVEMSVRVRTGGFMVDTSSFHRTSFLDLLSAPNKNKNKIMYLEAEIVDCEIKRKSCIQKQKPYINILFQNKHFMVPINEKNKCFYVAVLLVVVFQFSVKSHENM